MATRKNTTKAKTNTVKKPAARTRSAATKTTRSVKAAKTAKPAARAVAKKAAVTKTTVTSKTKSRTLTAGTLRKLNFIKAAVFTLLAVAAGMLMTAATYPLSVGYQAKDELLSLTAGKTAFVHGTQAIYDIEIRWLLVGFLALAAILSLLAATRWRAKYEASLVTGVSPLRWIGLGVTSAIMVETIALLSGISDIFTLKIVAGLVLATTALGWVVEKRNRQAGRPVWSEYVVSLFVGSLPWLLIGGYAAATWVYGLIRYPWYVYALIGSTLLGFSLLAANQYKRIDSWKNNLVVERNYLLIGFATKAAFAAILILAFQK